MTRKNGLKRQHEKVWLSRFKEALIERKSMFRDAGIVALVGLVLSIFGTPGFFLYLVIVVGYAFILLVLGLPARWTLRKYHIPLHEIDPSRHFVAAIHNLFTIGVVLLWLFLSLSQIMDWIIRFGPYLLAFVIGWWLVDVPFGVAVVVGLLIAIRILNRLPAFRRIVTESDKPDDIPQISYHLPLPPNPARGSFSLDLPSVIPLDQDEA